MWGPQPPDAAYVHGLVIDRNHAGLGLGRALLDWAGQQARQAGRSQLRAWTAARTTQPSGRTTNSRGSRRSAAATSTEIGTQWYC